MMKKLFSLLLLFLLATHFDSYAAFSEGKTEAKENYGVFKSAEMKAAAEAFVSMSRKEYEQLTGKRLSLTERLAFKVAQKQVKHQLIGVQQTYGFNIGGFMLGFLLSAIGILLAYAFSQDTNVRKWAWIGAIVNLIIILIIVL